MLSYRRMIQCLPLVLALAAPPSEAANGAAATGWRNTNWGETSAALAKQFGGHAVRLDRSIDFGDSYVDVVLKNYDIGGYAFIVYFQMDKSSHGLKRIQIERGRHGAVPQVSTAAFNELTQIYGAPSESCASHPQTVDGQALVERIWHRDGTVVRALFREQSLNTLDPYLARAFGDFTFFGASTEGLSQQLLIRIAPAGTESDDCRPKPG
jgi:hypothetical protein